MSVDLSIFISCFNEQESVISTIVSVTTALTKLTSLSWEILIIDDCSNDNSVQCIKQYIQENPDLPVRLCVNQSNKGLVKNIFEAASTMSGKYFWCVAGDDPVSSKTCLALFSHIGAYSDDVDHTFRRKWITDSDASGSLIPNDVDHSERSDAYF